MKNNKAKHTPGPWKIKVEKTIDYDSQDYGNETPIKLDYYSIKAPPCDLGYEHQIAQCNLSHGVIGKCSHEVPAEANARLIAAAPDMLEMFEAILLAHYAGQPAAGPSIKDIENIVAKTKGGE